MATAPVPFTTSPPVFFPTTATYPPFFYHAPPAFPYPTPASVCTPPPGGYYNSPFPFYYHNPPAFPCPLSATTSYPPEFGSFLSKSSCPTREVTPIPTTVDQNQPPPAQTPIYGGPIPANKIANGGVPAGSSVMELHEHVVPRMVENKVSAFHRVSADSVYQGGDLTRGNGAGGRSINGEELVHKQPGTEILSMASNDSNHGFITRQATTTLTPSVGFAPSPGSKTMAVSAPSIFWAEASSSASSVNSPFGASATAGSVAPKVFDKMPIPSSGQETKATTPNFCDGHQTPVQSSCVRLGSANLSEQYLDGLPHHYGFSNLNRQRIILADGTERSYFTLPADYPLKQATPQMSLSAAANIAVTAQLPVEAKAACLTAFCCSKTNRIADSEAMLVHDVQPPTAVQDDHKEQNDEKAVGNIQKLRDSDWNVLVIPGRRREWDPGEHTNLSSTLSKDALGVPILVPQQSCYYRVPLGQENHIIQFLWDPGILSLLNMLLGKTASPNQVHSGQSCLVTKEVQVQVDSGMPIISPERPTAGIFSFTIEKKSENELHAVCLNNSGNAFSDTDFPFPHGPVTHAAKSIELTKENSTQEVLARTCSNIAALTWDNSVTKTPFQLLNNPNYTWDPGVLSIINMIVDKNTVSHPVQFVQRTSKLSFLSLTDYMKYFVSNSTHPVLHATALTMQRAAQLSQGLATCQNQVIRASYVLDPSTRLFCYNSGWLPNGSEFRDGQLAYLTLSPAINSSEF